MCMTRFALLLLVLFSVSATAQKVTVERIDPPGWWTNMEHNQLELLVYGTNVGSATVTSSTPNLRIVQQRAADNPNYLYVEVAIAGGMPDTDVVLTFKGKGKPVTKTWSVKSRKPNPMRGVDASDFIYLIFPDRFSNGVAENDQVVGMQDQSLNRDSMFHRHGGDIQGIINHLDYVQELGATAIWINPMLENNQPETSYHGYAITDHYGVDPRFGSMEDYKRLVDEAHKRGLKIIIDVVFNHVGNEHWLIKDLPADNWLNQHETFTKTNYRATTLMDPYTSDHDHNRMVNGWFDHHMPDLNQRNAHVANYLIQNSIWLTEHLGIDGYRIDTYAYSDQKFMANWAKATRRVHPRIGMFGETWVHGTPVQRFFTENNPLRELNTNLPGVTDFQMYYAINRALEEPFGWTEGVSRLYYTLAKDYLYDDPYNNVLFLDNHDLSRYYSVCGEDFQKYKMGIGYMMTTRGIPSLYYGTEILMKNFADPDGKVRDDFPGGWEGDAVNKFKPEGRVGQEQEAFEYVSKLANWRKNTPVLHRGKLMQFVPEDGVFTFFRYSESECVMVVVNQNDAAKTLKMDRFSERTSGYSTGMDPVTMEQVRLGTELSVPAKSSMILQLK